jgi:hypothetical protein
LNRADAFRADYDDYLDDIEPGEIEEDLQNFSPEYDWSHMSDLADPKRRHAWNNVARSEKLRKLAYDGYDLYETVFPRDTKLRAWIDSLLPGWKLKLIWTEAAKEWAHIPWGLMYCSDSPPPGEPVDALKFLGLRFRVSYKARKVDAGPRGLGSLTDSYAAHLHYWGETPNELRMESDWQRSTLRRWNNQIVVPDFESSNFKDDLCQLLRDPTPPPMRLLYFFCRTGMDVDNRPALRFNSSSSLEDTLTQEDLGTQAFADRPLIFANACATSASDPYSINELERAFFRRMCRAYIGTEVKIPIRLASRFGWLFLKFFFRDVDPAPLSAGEAISQARLFLWTRYRNVGGLFYCVINQDDLYMASEREQSDFSLAN